MFQLISVTSRATLVARAVAFVTIVVGLLVNFGWITTEQADAARAWLISEQAERIIVGIALLVSAFLPSVAGWVSKDKELPPGVDVPDVQVKPEANVPTEARVALERRAASVRKTRRKRA